MKDLTGVIKGTWKILGFSHTKVRNVKGKQYKRYRYYWLCECLNCKFRRTLEISHFSDHKKCQNCYGKNQGEAGLATLLDSYKRNSIKNSRKFELSKHQFQQLTSEPCFYCKSLPTFLKRGGKADAITTWGNYYYNGIDRIDNSIGYVWENCISCCMICNRAKNNMSYKDFIAYTNRMKRRIFMIDIKDFKGKNYVNGKWIGREDFVTVNPSNNCELFKFPITQKKEVEEAVEKARTAFYKWKNISRVKRAEYFDNLATLIKENHKRLQEVISLETGKSLNEANAEVLETLHMVQYVFGTGRQPCGDIIASELSTKESYVIRKPKGVVAVISPNNFPLAIGTSWQSACAIVEGNTVVHKPSEQTPMIAQLAAELYEKAGFPEGVYNLIHGAEETGRNLVESNVDCILFTGSAEVGRYIRQHCATTWNKTCSCEMGGKSAVIIFDDANQSLALEAALASAFKLSGQRCVTSGRILVQRSIIDDFAKEFVKQASEIHVCDPFETEDFKGFTYGPIFSKHQLERVESFNNLVRNDKDAKVLYDPDKDGKIISPGNYLRPFVYQTEWRDVPYLKDEVFGPHVALIPFDSVDHAICYYNDTEYGLSLGVVTEDFRVMRKIRDNCNAGMIYLNGGSVAAESHLVFGGLGKSGYGHKSAAGTYRAVTDEVAVTVNYEADKISWAQGMK